MDGHDTKLLGWTFAVALFLHWLFLQSTLPPDRITLAQQEKKNDAPIELEHYSESQRKPVVQTSELEKQDPENKSEAEFFGEFRNRVKKETQASIKGRFQEGEAMRGEGGAGETPAIEGEWGEPSGKVGKAGELGMRDLMRFARSPSALPKEIAEGSQTLLNTDKVLYASFMNRIADEIYQPWVSFGQQALQEVLGRGSKIEPNLFITKLTVTMNEFGEVTGMTILRSSGIPELDEAPKKAFWKIARFPNPPSQLFDADKFIRITYEFQFEWKSSGFNIVPWAI